MVVKIVPNGNIAPAGKLADAELHFSEGPLAGLKLIGFSIWESRTGSRRNVTFPARQYSVNGERRSFALLRPADGMADSNARIRDFILAEYAAYEEEQNKVAVASAFRTVQASDEASRREARSAEAKAWAAAEVSKRLGTSDEPF